MGMRENFDAISAAMSQTDGQRDAAMMRRMKQNRANMIESLDGLATGLRANRGSAAAYLAENGIDAQELESLYAACSALVREIKWIG